VPHNRSNSHTLTKHYDIFRKVTLPFSTYLVKSHIFH